MKIAEQILHKNHLLVGMQMSMTKGGINALLDAMEEYASQFKQPVVPIEEEVKHSIEMALLKYGFDEQESFAISSFINKFLSFKQTQSSSKEVPLTDHAFSLGTIVENGGLTSLNTDAPIILPISSKEVEDKQI